MSVTSVLVGLLSFGFVAVALVGFLGWRTRMRDAAINPFVSKDQRRAA